MIFTKSSEVNGRYRCIVADPPWEYDSRSSGGIPTKIKNNGGISKSVRVEDRYHLMSLGRLMAMPVQRWLYDDAHLYLWTTNSFMVQAHSIAEAWGVKVRTILTWGKVKPKFTNCCPKASMKSGYWFRGATEHCLFCTRGKLRLTTSDAYPTLYLSGRLPHSVKPDWFYRLVEECSPGPRLDMFARIQRDGWSALGDQVV